MNYRRRAANFSNRWGIQLDVDVEFAKLRSRIINVVDRAVGELILNSPDLDRRFLLVLGAEPPALSSVMNSLREIQDQFASSFVTRTFDETSVHALLISASTIVELAQRLQTLFWVFEEMRPDYDDKSDG